MTFEFDYNALAFASTETRPKEPRKRKGGAALATVTTDDGMDTPRGKEAKIYVHCG